MELYLIFLAIGFALGYGVREAATRHVRYGPILLHKSVAEFFGQ
jgi:hypothetical protein